MKFFAVVTVIAAGVVPVWSAPRSTPPLPPSAVLFNGDYSFRVAGTTYSTAVNAPMDGAWLTGSAVWNHSSFPYWDCSHNYAGTLAPNNNDYTPLFIAGWDANSICSNQPPVFGCLNCGVDWGGVKAFPGFYMTTSNTPGFLAAGSGTIVVSSNNGGGLSDLLTLHIEQVNRNAMVNMTMYQSVDEENPAPEDPAVVADRYFIAESADRVPVVPVFHYGTDAQGNDLQFPAGPDVTYAASWDSGAATSTPEIAFAQQGLHGHTIVAVPIPKLATGSHPFTITATLPSGTRYTTPSMTVFVYAKSIYVTVSAVFNPRNPEDDLPNFIPGSDLNGVDLDLRSGPQALQLNILIGRNSAGTFEVHLRNPTYYPGVAMNSPIGAPDPDPNPDIDFGGGIIDLLDVPIPHGGAPKVVRLPLYVHDYAAAATIEATIPYRKKKFTTKRHIPVDANGSGLPDAGWRLPTGSRVQKGNLTASSDDDPATGGGATGDGLTALEEFRGFFVAGQHARTDPRAQDLFLDLDPAVLALESGLSGIQMLLRLPLTLHFLEPGDSSSQNFSGTANSVARIKPVINPNRGTIAGSNEQRAVRLAYQVDDPIFQNLVTGQSADLYTIDFGGMFNDTDNLDVVNVPYSGAGPAPPGHTQVVEYYPRAFENIAIAWGANGILDSLLDRSGNPVPDCNVSPVLGCDVRDTSLQVVHRFSLYMNTVLNSSSDDFYTQIAYEDCGRLLPRVAVLPSEFRQLKLDVIGHEVAHGIGVQHTNLCLDLMYDDNAGNVMSTYLPYPTDYSATDLQGIRLH